jgi:hypothetical protein
VKDGHESPGHVFQAGANVAHGGTLRCGERRGGLDFNGYDAPWPGVIHGRLVFVTLKLMGRWILRRNGNHLLRQKAQLLA